MSLLKNVPDPWVILDLPHGERNSPAVKAAYKKKSLILHPDKPNGSEEKFKQLQVARDILLDSSLFHKWKEQVTIKPHCSRIMCHNKYGRLVRGSNNNWTRVLTSGDQKLIEETQTCRDLDLFCEETEEEAKQYDSEHQEPSSPFKPHRPQERQRKQDADEEEKQHKSEDAEEEDLITPDDFIHPFQAGDRYSLRFFKLSPSEINKLGKPRSGNPGIVHADQLLGQFFELDQDEMRFQTWLETFGSVSQYSASKAARYASNLQKKLFGNLQTTYQQSKGGLWTPRVVEMLKREGMFTPNNIYGTYFDHGRDKKELHKILMKAGLDAKEADTIVHYVDTKLGHVTY